MESLSHLGLKEIEFMQIVWSYWSLYKSQTYLNIDPELWHDFLTRSPTGPLYPVYCCECYEPIEFHPAHVSHIWSKGANPAYRLDFRNVKPLCYKHHQQWETGKKRQMKIYDKCQEIITTLKREYYDHRNIKRYNL